MSHVYKVKINGRNATTGETIIAAVVGLAVLGAIALFITPILAFVGMLMLVGLALVMFAMLMVILFFAVETAAEGVTHYFNRLRRWWRSRKADAGTDRYDDWG